MASEPDRTAMVFVVDDEAVVRDSVCVVVQTMGFAVQGFSSASEFLDFFESYDVSGSVCLIADIQMPKVSGVDLLEQLIASGKQCPVILVTGHGGAALKDRALGLGAAGYLEKPFRPADLQAVISEIIERDTNEDDGPAR